jgi:esterase/lipase
MTSSEERYKELAKRVSEIGIIGLTINIRGHGDRKDKFDESTINQGVSDALASYDFLTSHDFINPERVGICGASYGGALAAIVAGQRNVKSLILRAPATYTEEMMEESYKNLMDQERKLFHVMEDLNNTPPIRSLDNYSGDLLVILSENDAIIPEIIPDAFLFAARNARGKERIVIKEATHNLSENSWREEFINKSVDWFKQTL